MFATAWTNIYGSMAPRRTSGGAAVSLASRKQIDKIDCGLRGVDGAREIIHMIHERRSVTKLILGMNHLGDQGCVELFGFLSSETGRQYAIAEISLNGNEIGDLGLKALADYIAGNIHLKELFLQNNAFKGNRDVVSAFTAALNTSRITNLSLNSNYDLSDPFLSNFLHRLSSPHLRRLDLSLLNLTSISVSTVISFIGSTRARYLRFFSLNGNSLGNPGMIAITNAVRESNFTLSDIGLHANNASSDSSSSSDGGEMFDWKSWELTLKKITTRNKRAELSVQSSAAELLVYARTLLLRSSHPLRQQATPSPSPPPPSSPSSDRMCAAFEQLPMELKLQIFSNLAPVLSSAQLTRIYNYASSCDTLPTVLSFPRHSCMADPSGLPSFMGGNGCSSGNCMGVANSLVCRRAEDRVKYLSEVDCLAFEADRTAAARIAQLFA